MNTNRPRFTAALFVQNGFPTDFVYQIVSANKASNSTSMLACTCSAVQVTVVTGGWVTGGSVTGGSVTGCSVEIGSLGPFTLHEILPAQSASEGHWISPENMTTVGFVAKDNMSDTFTCFF